MFILVSFVIILLFCSVSGWYLVWNLTQKNNILGEFVTKSYNKARATYIEMKEIDSVGAFESDDEVGAIFESLENSLAEYVDFINMYVEEVDIVNEMPVNMDE